MIQKTERYPDTLKQALTRQRQKVSHECLRQKRPWKRETVHKCLWQRKKEQTTNAVAKKDQTTNAGGKRKMAALIRQANSWHQMNETKQLQPPQNPRWLPTCKHKVEPPSPQKKHNNKHTHTQKNNNNTKTTTTNHNSLTQTTVCKKGVDDYSHKSTEQK